MSLFGFYESRYNPTGLSGTVGGPRTDYLLEPRLGELFAPMSSYLDSTVTQYRKVFIKQDEEATLQDVSVILSNVEHTGQVSFALSTGQLEESSENAVTAPDGIDDIAFSGNHINSILLTGSSTIDDVYAIWLRVSLPTGAGSDEVASFGVRVKGTRLN